MGQQMKGLVCVLTCIVVLTGTLFGAPQTPGDDPQPLYPIFENGLWGLIDTTGRVVLPPTFQQISRGGVWIPETWDAANPPGQVLIDMTFTKGTPVTDRVIPVRLEGRLALATRDGDILVHGEYERMASLFTEGLLWVVSDGRFGFVDETGDLVIPARWEQVRWFRNGHAFVMAEGRWGIIDRTGNEVVAPRWDQVGSFASEWVPVRLGEDWGVIDRTGNEVVPVQYDEIRATPMGPLMPVHDDGRIFYVRPDGAGTVAFEFICPNRRHRKDAMAFGFFGNHAAVVRCGERDGVIDESGAFVLAPEWEDINNFINGRALVRHDGRMGVIDESGGFVVELEREIRLWGVGEEEIGFSRGDQHGYFGRDGRVLRTFTVDADRFGSFVDGLAVARNGIKDGYIDRSGGWVIEPRFHKAEPFRGPLAVVKQPVTTDLVEIGYINRAGEAVYRVKLGGFVWPEHLVDPAGIARPQP
jgi:hypothetical protein